MENKNSLQEEIYKIVYEISHNEKLKQYFIYLNDNIRNGKIFCKPPKRYCNNNISHISFILSKNKQFVTAYPTCQFHHAAAHVDETFLKSFKIENYIINNILDFSDDINKILFDNNI